jgi:hypothetical protein
MRIAPMLVALPLLGATAWPDGQAAAQAGRAGTTTTGKRCQMNAIERSKCIIEAILADISRTYTQVGGGGISAIRQNSTTSYTVSIAQEERVDLLTYEAEIDAGGRVRVSKIRTDAQPRGN